jgi:hypothetical protein
VRARRPVAPRPRAQRIAGPVPAQVVVTPPAYVPVAAHARVKPYVGRRRVGPSQPPQQDSPPATGRARLKWPKLARGRAVAPTPAQVAPVPPAYVPQLWRARFKPAILRRRSTPAAPPDQLGILANFRAKLKFPKPTRGRQAQVVPPQTVVTPPSYPPASVRPRLKFARLFRGRQVTPVPPQVAVTPPTYVPQGLRARVRSLRLPRGRTVTPTPPQIVVTPPAYVPQGLRARVRSLRLFRGRTAQPVPPQVAVTPPAYVPGRARQAVLRQATVHRGHAAMPPVAQAPAPLVTRIKLRMARIFRGKVRPVVPPQIIVVPPAYPPQPVRGRRKLFGLRRRRAGVDAAMVAGVHVCETPRPNTGSTPRPSTGTTAHATGTTARPGTGVTLRPDSGQTTDPC